MKKIVKSFIVCLGLFGLVALGSAKIVRAEDLTATLAYTGSTSINMTGSNDASKLITEVAAREHFSVVGYKNSTSNLPGLNKDGTIRLYNLKNSTDGGSIAVTVIGEYIITGLEVHVKSGGDGEQVSVSGTQLTKLPESTNSISKYALDNATQFEVKNVIKSESSVQMHLNKIVILYKTVGGEPPVKTATEKFEELNTKTSLSFKYTKNEADFAISDLALRFGTTITKELYDNLLLLDSNAKFGVAVILSDTLNGEQIINAIGSAKKQEIAPVRVAEENALVADENGAFYQFAFVVDQIPMEEFRTYFTAVVYVVINGETHYMLQAEHSAHSAVLVYQGKIPAHAEVLDFLADYRP